MKLSHGQVISPKPLLTASGQLSLMITAATPTSNAEFRAEGLSFEELSEILKSICTEVYFQQDKTSRIYRQSGGLPMGGKASAEIANV